MKRLFFLLIVAVACVLPQSAWAQSGNEASLDTETNTLTITSSAAGKLSANPSQISGFPLGHGVPATVTKIKLEGYFNASDLAVIKGDEGDFTGVTNVDMGEAYFTRNKNTGDPSSYIWFSGTPSGSAGSEAHALSGGTLYQLQYPRVWESYNQTPTSNITSYASVSDMNNDLTGNVGRFAKTAKYVYRQMTISSQSWTSLGVNKDNDKTPFNVSWLGNVINDHLSEYQNGDNVRVYEYYQVVKIDQAGGDEQNNLKWSETPVYPTDAEIEAAIDAGKRHVGEWVGATYGNLEINEYCHLGDYIRFDVYYRKEDSRSWTDPATDNDPGSAINEDFLDTDRNSNMRYADNAWVRMVAYSYYQLIANSSADASTRNWVQITDKTKVDVVKYHFDDINGSDANTAKSTGNDGDYAVVGGSHYVYTGSSWETYESWSSTTFTFDYSDMKFDYWKSSLTTATTSRFANESISDQIFDGCTKLTHVDYLGGNVTGFGDHKTEAGYYSPFTIKIGKDVTKISNAAFRRCDVLTEVEWGPYAEGDQHSMVYPKELIIDNEAFMQAKNLMSITIPNRVTRIGDNAFEQVGNGATSDVNDINNHEDHTFTLTFERRNANDIDQGPVAISCDKPLTLGNKAFFDCWYLKNLSLPIRLESMGEDCFKNTVKLKTLEMREETSSPYTPPTGHDLLRTIPSGAFEGSSVEEVTIPKCVTRIESKAFGSTTNLQKVTFQTNTETSPGKPLYIEGTAFAGGREESRPQLDIYVMVNPADRLIICEYQAFNYTQTVGQTSTIQNFANLHFPEEYWDYYQGNWKRGLAFRQDNLNAFKDGYSKDNESGVDYVGKSSGVISTTTGKYMTADNNTTTIYTPGNGWQEFARTSTNIDIEIPNTGSFMRTYSTKKPMALPLYAEDDTQQQVHKGDPFFKVYRISHFDDKWSGSGSAPASDTPVATATEVKLHYDNASHTATNYENAYIPKETGLLMTGVGVGAVNYIVYMKEVEDEDATITYPFTQGQNENVATDVVGTTNLLFPSCEDDSQTTRNTENGVPYVYLNPTYPFPYASNSQPDYRFFALAARTVNSAKEYYFTRFAKNGKITRDKAYLKLSKDVFHWTNEGETASGYDYNNANASRVALNFFDDEEESETTGIKQVDTTMQRVDSNVFYTLEGVKLNSRPTQRGIYIHNGRKVVIK